MLLPDVNVWVALTFDKHPHHPSAWRAKIMDNSGGAASGSPLTAKRGTAEFPTNP
jgi:hypothetical protein